MRSFLFNFEERTLIRAWPHEILIRGTLEIFFSRSDWHIGSVQIECFRHGEHFETRCYHEKSRRAQRIHALVLNDPLWCARIDEDIDDILESDRELAQESRYDERREAAV